MGTSENAEFAIAVDPSGKTAFRPARMIYHIYVRLSSGPRCARGGIGVASRPMKPPILSRSPDILGGTPVFCGTRVPVQTLLEYLEAGDSIDEFLAGFPAVTRAQVVAFLEDATARLLASVA